MKIVTEFGGQNWAIRPVALAFNEPAPKRIQDQKWELSLAGVAIVNVTGGSSWVNDTVKIFPDVESPMKFILNKMGAPLPTDSPYVVEGSSGIATLFQLEQWMPFAALASIFDANTAVNAGFTINSWRPAPFQSLVDARPAPNNTAPTITNIFNGIIVEVGASDIDAVLLKVSYHVTLIGKIVFAKRVIF